MVKRDLPARALAVAVRALPAHRAEWGLAMEAELAALDGAARRRSYALGCARAVLTRPGTLLRLGTGAFAPAVGAVSVGLALAIPSPAVRAEALALIAILAAALWLGRHRGLLGPVADDSTSRRVRASACVLVGVLLVLMLWPSRGGGKNDPGGAWIAALAVVLYLVAALYATARPTAAGPHALRLGCGLTVAVTALWWVPMLLSAGVRSHPGITLALELATVVAGCALAAWRRLPAHAAIVAGLGAGAATCLAITLLALGSYAVRPSMVPHFCGTSDLCGLTPAARTETERIESTDPYVADLLLGALLAGLLIVAGTAELAVAGEPGRRAAR